MEYFISDLHLFHENCLKFDNRPFSSIEEQNECIVKNWNSRITNGDVVYILGDISMRGANEDLIQLVSILKGCKVLIKGNHDKLTDYRYRQLFYDIVDYREVTTTISNKENPKNKDQMHVILSHYPILMWNNQHRGYIHLYGHVHNSVEEVLFQNAIGSVNNHNLDDRRNGDKPLRAYNVGAMMPWMNYTPRTLEEIISGYIKFKSDDYRG